MAYLEWSDNYSVGVASLDAQHKELVRLINRLHDDDERGDDLTPVLDRLDWYVHYHFSFEESLMKAAKYEGFDEHIGEHREFENWLRTSRRAMTSGMDIQELSRIIADFLKNWLRKHILVVDMDYKALLTAHHASGGALQVLTDEMIRTLEATHGALSPDGVDRVLALARDIRLCAKTLNGH